MLRTLYTILICIACFAAVGCGDDAFQPTQGSDGNAESSEVLSAKDDSAGAITDDSSGAISDDAFGPRCLTPKNPAVTYYIEKKDCQYARVYCEAGTSYFSDDCGCGCVKDEPVCLNSDPDRQYIGNSPEQCAVIRFACDADQQYFADDCGCGCEPADYCEDTSTKQYAGHSYEECSQLRIVCPEGQEYFYDNCGCGCERLEHYATDL